MVNLWWRMLELWEQNKWIDGENCWFMWKTVKEYVGKIWVLFQEEKKMGPGKLMLSSRQGLSVFVLERMWLSQRIRSKHTDLWCQCDSSWVGSFWWFLEQIYNLQVALQTLSIPWKRQDTIFICLFVCLSMYLFVYLFISIYLFMYLSIYVPIHMYISIKVAKIQPSLLKALIFINVYPDFFTNLPAGSLLRHRSALFGQLGGF